MVERHYFCSICVCGCRPAHKSTIDHCMYRRHCTLHQRLHYGRRPALARSPSTSTCDTAKRNRRVDLIGPAVFAVGALLVHVGPIDVACSKLTVSLVGIAVFWQNARVFVAFPYTFAGRFFRHCKQTDRALFVCSSGVPFWHPSNRQTYIDAPT